MTDPIEAALEHANDADPDDSEAIDILTHYGR